MISMPKGEVSERVLASLKAGHPERLIVNLDNATVEEMREIILQRNHASFDDAEVDAMEAASYDALKAQFLSAYSPAELTLAQDFAQVPTLVVRIHDLDMLHRLQDDPRVTYVGSGDQRYYPA